MRVLFSDFPKDTAQNFNDIYWEIASEAKRDGHTVLFVKRNDDPEQVISRADVLVVFKEFAKNRQLVKLATEKGCPVIELLSSPFSAVWNSLQTTLWEIEEKKNP